MKKKERDDENIVYVNGTEETANRNRENREQLMRQRKIVGLAAILVVLIAGIIVYAMMHREYKGYRVVQNNETNYENTANYTQFAGNLLKYTPDGVSYINENGDVVWSAGIDMMMPMAVTSGSYAVVADMSGNTVCVFNTEGQVSSLTMPYKICDVDVANQGAFAVVLESDKTNYINMYDKNGESIYEKQTTIDKSGYPLDITISDDAQKLFTSYINVSGNSVQDSLAAYNFGDVGQNSNADRMVGGYMFDNEVVPKVEFIDNDTVVAFGTSTVSIYSMKEKPSEKAKLTFDEEIRSIFYSTEYIGVVQNNADGAAEHPYKIKVYDLRGNKKFEDYIDFAYDNIYAAEKEIIVSGNSNCLIYRMDGSVKFNGTLSGKITSVVPSGRRLEYVVIYENATEIIKLKAKAGKHDDTAQEASGGDNASQNTTSQGTTAQDITGQDGAGQDGAAQDGAGQNGAGQDGAAQDGAGQDGAAQDGAGQNDAAQDMTTQDDTSQTSDENTQSDIVQ